MNKADRTSGWYARLQRFMAQNRVDNLRYKTGWHERLQAIYHAHFELLELTAGRTPPTPEKNKRTLE